MHPTKPKQATRKKRIRWGRLIAFLLLLGFLLIQFFQPDKNNNTVSLSNDITSVVQVPDTVNLLLHNACYDCHSNNTNYPWYTNIQPVGWWLNKHIRQGKRRLNFNEFATYTPQRQQEKLDEIADSQADGWMPLPSYTWVHAEARLTAAEKQEIVNWVAHAKQKISAR